MKITVNILNINADPYTLEKYPLNPKYSNLLLLAQIITGRGHKCELQRQHTGWSLFLYGREKSYMWFEEHEHTEGMEWTWKTIKGEVFIKGNLTLTQAIHYSGMFFKT